MTEEKSTIAGICGTCTSLHGILAGLTFTATVLFFTYQTNIPASEIFIALTLMTTIFFVFGAVLSADASFKVLNNKIPEAKEYLKFANYFGLIGFLLMFLEISYIAFSVGLIYGIPIVLTIPLVFLILKGKIQ